MGNLILLGVVSGVLSTVLVWVFSRFRADTLLPWYQRLLYRGVLIDGSWKGTRQDGDTKYGFTFDLKQNGHKLGGTFTTDNKSETRTNIVKAFEIDGEIAHDCVLLRYTPVDQHTYGSGAFLFQVFDGGRVLKGGMLYFSTRIHQIGSVHDLCLERTIG